MIDTVSSVKPINKIGLFGGSFDPPHLGHVALVHAGLAMGLDEVWVIPAFPVHRVLSGKADAGTRLLWLQQLFESEPRVRVLDWEVSQSKPTPAVHTLRKFKATYPGIVPWLMLGQDAWQGLESWFEYPSHQKLCNVAVFARQSDEFDETSNRSTSHTGWQTVAMDRWTECVTPGHYCDVAVLLPDVSATLIRKNAAMGLSLTELVPKVLQSDIARQYRKK